MLVKFAGIELEEGSFTRKDFRYWFKLYDLKGNCIYFESNKGYWVKSEYDSNGNLIYYENSNGYWTKKEFDLNGNYIYFETSEGKVIDNRGNKNVEKY